MTIPTAWVDSAHAVRLCFRDEIGDEGHERNSYGVAAPTSVTGLQEGRPVARDCALLHPPDLYDQLAAQAQREAGPTAGPSSLSAAGPGSAYADVAPAALYLSVELPPLRKRSRSRQSKLPSLIVPAAKCGAVLSTSHEDASQEVSQSSDHLSLLLTNVLTSPLRSSLVFYT